ncbi:MAG: YchJ family protein [Marinobacter sp.]
MPECPCGSGQPYNGCCQPFHHGAVPAPTPEALMRSRFSAFVLALPDYLRATWHPDTRPVSLNLDDAPRWTTLQVLSSAAQGDHGQVRFRALYRLPKAFGYLEETSDFVRVQGHWYYLGGSTREGRLDPGRNERCPCGSGRKFKACCLRAGEG